MVKVTKHGEQASVNLPYKKRESRPRRTKEEKELIIQRIEKLIKKYSVLSLEINREELKEIAKEGDLTISELRYYLRLLLKSKREHKNNWNYINRRRR